MTSVTIGNSVDSIGEYAFQNCTGLTVTYYNGTIADWCKINFGGYSANPVYSSHNLYINNQPVPQLSIPNSVTTIGDYAFVECTGLTGELTIPESVTSIGVEAFSGCTGLTAINYNAVNCQSVGFYWLYNCTGLASMSIGDAVQNIPANLFSGCAWLTGTLTIPSSVTRIGDNAFSGCTGLTGTLTIPNSVTSIGSAAFSGCTGLHVLDLGSGLTSLGENAFNNCNHFDTIYARNPSPASVADVNAFENVWKGLPLLVPTGSRSAYANAYAWREFTNNVEESDGSQTTYCLRVGSNDPSMGSVTVTLTATPNAGYHFVRWADNNTDNPRTLELVGDMDFTAYFEADGGNTGIDGAAYDGVTLLSCDGRIVVTGAEGRRVTLTDAVGRILYRGTAMKPLTLDAPASGVYLIHVEGPAAKRVAVVK